MDGLMDGCDLDLYHVEKWAIEKEKELWLQRASLDFTVGKMTGHVHPQQLE